MRPILAGLVLGGILLLPSVGQAYPALSWHRVSVGADARGVVVDTPLADETTGFRAGAYLSYSVTSMMALAGTVERGFSEDITVGHLGVRFLLAQVGVGQVAAGANVVGYGDAGAAGIAKPTSWSASAHGNWPIAWKGDGSVLAAGIVSAEWDMDNDLTTYRLGLRWQGWGGRP